MDMQPIVTFAEETAREAGQIMREYFWARDKGTEIKSDRSPVTLADKKINQLVIERAAKSFPDCGVLGEEASSEQTGQHEMWVCDPIDGTAGFIVGVPTAMFSLAFVQGGVPIVGVAYDPFMDRMFTAVKGRGAHCNGAPLQASTTQSKGAIFAGSGSFRDVSKLQEMYEDLEAKGMRVTAVPGAVFRGCLVAEGRVDGWLFAGAGAHDIAAIKVIIEEAGGRVTDITGSEQRYDRPLNGAIISNGAIHDELVAAVKKYGVEKYMSLKR